MMGPNVKIPLDVILVLSNMRMGLSNVRKQNRVPPNMTKLQSKVMLVLANMIMELLNMRKKKQGTIEYDKCTVRCNVGTA